MTRRQKFEGWVKEAVVTDGDEQRWMVLTAVMGRAFQRSHSGVALGGVKQAGVVQPRI